VRSKQLTSHSPYFILYSLANTRLIFRVCSEQYTGLIEILFFKVTKFNLNRLDLFKVIHLCRLSVIAVHINNNTRLTNGFRC